MSMSLPVEERATKVRYQILAATTAASIILYVHRAFISEVLKYEAVLQELGLMVLDPKTGQLVPDAGRLADTYSAFFLSYALFQVPSGWIADRFGRRISLFMYIVAWSICTALGGFVMGFVSLFFVRLALGFAQAGAYPTSGGLIARWIPLTQRTFASAMVGAGGRVGGIIAPLLTSLLIAQWMVPWRVVMLLYGIVGVAIGVWFWVVSRNEPSEHPRCNDAERELIAAGRTAADLAETKVKVRAPVGEMLTSRSMWCMGLMQFGTNVGWAFIITTWPTYLKQVKHASDVGGGGMTSMIWTLGVIGLLLGGRATDFLTPYLGLRWGRMLLTILSRLVAAALYGFVLIAEDAWQASIAMAAVVFVCDIGVPATWSFAQDVGGKSVGAVLGWGNMFGNLGAAAATQIYAWADKVYLAAQTADYAGTTAPVNDMSGTLYAAMAGFIVSGLAAFGIDSGKPLVSEDRETPAA